MSKQVLLTSDSLVSTKLRPPEARPRLVARPRLIEKLERESGRKLTLLSAPAGFGKTTLLVEWLKDRTTGGRLGAWLSLDEGDNDPVRFLSYLVGALRTVEEGIGEAVLAALRSPEPPRMEALAGALINEIAALPNGLDLILDDYHVIDSKSAHRTVSFLLEHLPEDAHLVISSRVDPPLPLSRLRARNQMAEIGAAELAFTPEEAAAFLTGVMGLDLFAEDVAALGERTEGWVVGLQLAALSMRNRKDVSGFVESFSGGQRDVLDFLAEEVLYRQPESVRTFLLETSVLGRLTAPLCEAVTGRSDAQQMLEGLERGNLFVVALDEERRWYRYHHLFSDFLRGRLERDRPERIEELHRAAATWDEHHGLIDDALHHALAVGDAEWVARLIDQHIASVLPRGESVTVDRWLTALPTRLIRSQPRLCLARALRAMVGGRLDEFERLLGDAERALTATGDSLTEVAPNKAGWLANAPGLLAVLRADLARLRGDADRTFELSRRALDLLDERDTHLYRITRWNLAMAHWLRGDLTEAEQALAALVDEWRMAGDHYFVLLNSWYLGIMHCTLGHLRSAMSLFSRALNLDADRAGPPLPAAGIARIGLAGILCEQNELDAALYHVTEGIERCRQLTHTEPLAAGLATLVRIRQAEGDRDGALEAISEANQVGLSPEIVHLFNPVPVGIARLLLAQGDIAEAARWVSSRDLSVDDEPSFVREPELLILVRALLGENRFEDALHLLEGMREKAEATHRAGSLIEILSLQALALRATGEKDRAVSVLTRSLSLAQPEGYVRTFVDEGPPMAELLFAVLEAQQRGRLDPPIPAHYLRKLLAALEREAPSAAPPTAELPEPLSERELEVLQLLDAGKSNRQMAGELFVTAGTVKTHVRNIYRKLDAHNRVQVLARARERKLL